MFPVQKSKDQCDKFRQFYVTEKEFYITEKENHGPLGIKAVPSLGKCSFPCL